jgi:hypothetical protein
VLLLGPVERARSVCAALSLWRALVARDDVLWAAALSDRAGAAPAEPRVVEARRAGSALET